MFLIGLMFMQPLPGKLDFLKWISLKTIGWEEYVVF